MLDSDAGVWYGEGMKVALIDVDSKIPNLALMKLSAWHRQRGDLLVIEGDVDVAYASKVFTYTEEKQLPEGVTRGGSGWDLGTCLPEGIEHTCPDYTLYGIDYSMGFLTRGCDRKCPWCIVPEKEGRLRAHADFAEFLRHDRVVFLDNNVLGHAHGIAQIEKLAGVGVKVDFNQGLDARLIDDGVARRLARLRWWKPVRLACDTQGSMKEVQRAVALLRYHNCTPMRYRCYVLVREVEDALERVKFLKGLRVDAFAQPYRDRKGTPPTGEQRHFARWVNHPAVIGSCTWEEYREGKMKGERVGNDA